MSVKRGDRYTWDHVRVFVTRVAKDGTWADIICRGVNTSWSKRQPLPFPTTFVHVDPRSPR